MTGRCPSCRGAFPEGCSTCRPMPIIRGEIVKPIIRESSLAHSIEGLIFSGRIHTAEATPIRYSSDSDWKRDAFGDGAIQ